MKWLYIVLLLAAGHTACAQLARSLDSLIGDRPAGEPGFVISIEKNGAVLYRNARGLADLQTGASLDSSTNFRMASVTKQFTAMAILLLEADHRLSIEDPVGKWLPELPSHLGQTVLIRHLLTHSSGILDYESLIPSDRTTQVLDADVLQLLTQKDSGYFQPGTRFRYSNSGFCLLALIVEKASGQSFSEYLRGHIFLPLHMDGTTVYAKENSIPHRAMGYARNDAGQLIPSDQSLTSATKGDGGVYTSLVDYSKWMRALQQNTLLRLPAILKKLRFPIQGMPDSYYAAGWFMQTSSPVLLFHSGSTCGFANFVVQFPGDEWSLVYFSNIAGNTAPFESVCRILQRYGMAGLDQLFKLHSLTN